MRALYHLLPTKKPTSKTKASPTHEFIHRLFRRKPRWRSLAASGKTRELIHWLFRGRPWWRSLAALAMMFLSAVCFVGCSFYILLVARAWRSSEYAYLPIMVVTLVLWGGAQTLVAFAANQLGVGAQPPPLEEWSIPQGSLGIWALSVLGTLCFIVVAWVGLFVCMLLYMLFIALGFFPI